MYISYKDGEKVNAIAELTEAHIDFEIAAGHIFAVGDYTQENVDSAYDDIRRLKYSLYSDPMYIESDPLIASETGIQRVDWRNKRTEIKDAYPTPTI